ncbi:LPXTG cell wall anchor domain-containing protein [Streptomyces sp. MS1.HAVA.3]|uniref:LPXTG cell wall anchor domain-containing protein n=1 Tax=Streptomyces caledonius TaxID=3134107 RepID=A0ABU8U5V1_9ACTN
MRVQARLGAKTQLKKASPIKLESYVALASDNAFPFVRSEADFTLGPVKPTTPATPTAPTGTPSSTPSGTPSATPAASASASASATPVASASASTAPGGNLAKTGSDTNIGLYSGLAAALVGLGAAAWYAARRRTAR